jgi:ABC-2 type transport system ATP-binding protein
MNIRIDGLSMRYPGGALALDAVSLDIGSGMFGLLGPNGAGKTTLIKILATLLKPTGGSVQVDGHDLDKQRRSLRRRIGYLPQDFASFPKLSAREFLDYSARLKGIRSRKARAAAIDAVLDGVGLFDARDRRADKLSGGMKRRLGIAQSLLGNPPLMIIDEPTVGLDPEERARFRGLIAELAADRVILLSTHIVSDIAGTCNDMALLVKGRLAYRGSPARLTEQARDKTFEFDSLPSEIEKLTKGLAVISTVERDGVLRVRAVGDPTGRPGAEPVEPNLEDAYIAFMESHAGGKGGQA